MSIERELLVEQVNAKVRSAYTELFTTFYGALAYFSSRYVHRQEVAEDIVQEAFGRLWTSDTRFASYDSLVSYLYMSVRNASLDWLKRQKVEKKYIDRLPEQAHADWNEEYEVLREEVYRKLLQTVEKLPPRCREVFKLYLEGNTGPEIARLLDMSVETVRTHRKNALRTIRENMGPLFLVAVSLGFL